jgi:hypothetical protein
MVVQSRSAGVTVRTKAPRKAFRIPFGPWRGMRDSLDPTAAEADLASLLQNVYPADLAGGRAVIGRPGFKLFGAQLGAGGARTAQLVTQFTKLDGTEHTIAIVGGKVYKADWTLRTWTEILTAAELALASITLSTTARCWSLVVSDKLYITDGVNKPWLWDGTAHGGLTSITNSPVIYGRPTLYYAKVFGIKDTERSTIVWSEENDPTIGYEAGGYNNAWTLGQTSQDALRGLMGTNEALYYWRRNSVSAITGPVNSAFATTGTREGVSDTEGTLTQGMALYDRLIFFLDAEKRPHVLLPGAGVVPIWKDFSQTIAGIDATYIAKCDTVYDPATGLVLYPVVVSGQTVPTYFLAFDPNQSPPQAVAIFNGFDAAVSGTVKNLSGRPILIHIDTNGYAYDHGTPDGTYWNDEKQAGTTAIAHVVQPTFGAYDVEDEKYFERIDAVFRTPGTVMSSMRMDYETPRGTSTPLTAVPGGFVSLWDVATWDTSKWSAYAVEQHTAFGLRGFGRYIRPRFLHGVVDEQFGMVRANVTGRVYSNEPGVP